MHGRGEGWELTEGSFRGWGWNLQAEGRTFAKQRREWVGSGARWRREQSFSDGQVGLQSQAHCRAGFPG